MQYLLPRLRGWGESLSRQVGGRAAGGLGIGGRGPGETKIEIDRRRINSRMAKLRRELAGMKTARDVKRSRRTDRQVPAVVLAGYTNAGKSSLLNRLTDAGVLVENALFATLDPTVRRAETADGRRLHAGRHRRVRPAPAHPAGRGVPLDAGGGRRRRPDPARRRRLRRRPRGADPGRARGARRDRRPRRARAARVQQGRRRRAGDAAAAARARARRGVRVGPHRARPAGAARGDRTRGCRGPASRSPRWCPTPAAS